MVTAGTYAAGLSLGLRDALHEAGGYRWVLAAIAAGIGLSVILGDGRIALASAVAFGVAELTDLAVYVPLRRRNCTLAALDGIADVRVTGRFHTAGLEVTVEAA
jgi:glycerol-3-phosphate dehydrogenase